MTPPNAAHDPPTPADAAPPRSPTRQSGRPRSRPAQRFHPTSVRLNRDDLAQVDAVCARTGWSRNETIRIVLRLGFKLADTIPVKDTRAALEVGPPVPPVSGERGATAAQAAA